MPTLTTQANTLLGILTILGQIAIVVLFVLLALPRPTKLSGWLGRRGMLFAFLIALIATLGSLFYSEIAQFEPCRLCWYQRIFMYPQVILLGMALWFRERTMLKYGIVLSSIGAVIALYHYWLQVGGSPIVPCSAVGYSVSCSDKFVLIFGYITIPLMAFTAFMMNILLLTLARKHRGE